ncbi:GGDEF domain-containing protein [Lysinibacillus xylanilyticus]|uniref:tetratricopeptide repeat-containing diguanylate cyclase n=1 Tax=Lysinibacillus xylanilyticus TaxID=582475 RepID=UPI002B2423B5|nr:tetratricopeptide repeat-containing diguanylate cyclase [Lysinibacillus xylanilyticus]MEB2298930.1 GGDEF domain-containing protein [Lysinibacillus xylanilyticus]
MLLLYRIGSGLWKLNDHKSILTAHINNAASFYCIGDIEEAFNSIDSYHEVCNKYGDEADWVNLYNILFLLYEFNKDNEKAKETLSKSIKLAKKLKKYNIVSNGYSNLSHVYIAEGNYVNALEMAKLGLEMAKLHKPETPILEVRVKLNLAKSYIGLEDLDASKSLIDEIIKAPFLDSFIREKSQCYDLQGTWYTKKKLYLEAYESFTYAKHLVEGYNDVNLLKTIQEKRCELCELLNDVHLGYIVQKEYIALLKEISDRKLSLAALKLDIKHSISAIEAKANVDYLTGIYNRNYLETTVNDWLEQASIKNETIICLALDIDNFKAINDEFGHLFGDEVIKQVSKSCSSILRENELIGRYGGDEFIVILKGVSLEVGKEKAKQIEENIRNLKITKDEKSITIQVSIGAADNSGGKVSSFQDLFHFADIALYKAKKGGKNQICVSE